MEEERKEKIPSSLSRGIEEGMKERAHQTNCSNVAFQTAQNKCILDSSTLAIKPHTSINGDVSDIYKKKNLFPTSNRKKMKNQKLYI